MSLFSVARSSWQQLSFIYHSVCTMTRDSVENASSALYTFVQQEKSIKQIEMTFGFVYNKFPTNHKVVRAKGRIQHRTNYNQTRP